MNDFNGYWQTLVASNPGLVANDRLSLSIDEFRRMLAKTWNDAQKVPGGADLFDHLFRKEA